jgi:hypothetical protein
MTGTNTSEFPESAFALFVHLILTGATVVWASTHLDLIRLPIHLRIVLVQPGKAENDILIADASHRKSRMFRVVTKSQ